MKRLSLTAWIFIGMVAGIALGAFAPAVARQLGPVSAIFLRLIRSIIAPLRRKLSRVPLRTAPASSKGLAMPETWLMA